MTTTPVGEDVDWNKKNRDPSIPIYEEHEIKDIIDFNGLDRTRAERRQEEFINAQKIIQQKIQQLMKEGKPITQDILTKIQKEMAYNDQLPY